MTSSSMTKGANDRWKDRIVPVILETVESLKQNNFATVDVYLILGYHLPKTLEDELRDILSQNYDSGLEVWTDAAPMTYKCSAWDQPEGGVQRLCLGFANLSQQGSDRASESENVILKLSIRSLVLPCSVAV